MPLLLRLAFRNIFRQRRRSLLTALSIGGGYILCALSFSLLDGSYNNLIELFTRSKTGHIQIHQGNYLDRPKLHKSINDYSSIGEHLEQQESVDAFSYRIFAPGLAYSDDGNAPAQIIGIDLDREKQTTLIGDKISSGQYPNQNPDADGYYEVMIGVGISESLKISIGDDVILISQGADGSVANDVYKVSGIIGSRQSGDSNRIYMPLGAAQEFLTMYGSIHEIVIVLPSYHSAEKISEQLQTQFPELTVSPWQVVEADFYTSMQSDRQGNQVMLAIILFIVFIGVLNTVLMSVLERTREFGVLKAIGSRPKIILSLVALETTMLATLSVIVASAIAFPILYWFANAGLQLSEPVDVGGIMFQTFRGELSVKVFVLPLFILIGFALLISIPPGIRAAKIAPTKAMSSH